MKLNLQSSDPELPLDSDLNGSNISISEQLFSSGKVQLNTYPVESHEDHFLFSLKLFCSKINFRTFLYEKKTTAVQLCLYVCIYLRMDRIMNN